ncbi:MAG: hypothetical protein UR25_C0001G0040 [Candidatus Nomurabacteria bacterium GW2011_GWE1_32_28]|uniref:Transcobalamin-like C-terminal domain-containing protein n=1 Tax=Candidatus Nomurabacteria bacterium GW2011_GWF1_31_48 TaxID=1618767 RepID=A0A0G0ATA2_9BACT|nr:MAG: hypothetical protein UR10_C0005G0008 [Candidatus Nomurabacteria bacterium GW2011_GWF2_30_133]KKP28360.1 MAG: hypothetical protein UR18_C0005G0008 [Candidatus Nomurabacteria bacterium GW2011_GWE2_31_40]KKP29945.1 MAG: hypothetical protein UR19_C0006G0008 [Candidatus Nomurabacteria bacterium GW2011_GWF1_31_48]KKP35128.1 MAG: hypothetical protein UR25_C0001G0040 [Candidatus Nomurabacteria bacterium GW2011_GWE1_32_28]HAS80940.1 hypothetical protein [Candidatus Nomurabacteria bacterium]
MKIKGKYKITIIIITLLVILFLNKKIQIVKQSEIDINSKTYEEIPKIIINKAVLEVNGIKYETEINQEVNIYDFMVKLKEEGKINFKDKTYSGIGKFIEEINGIKSSNEKYWLYYVNNKKADIGISDYKIKPGDIISWKLEKI